MHAVITVKGTDPRLWHPGSASLAPFTGPPKSESTLSQAGLTSSVNKHHSPCLHGASSKASLSVPGTGSAKRLCTVRGLAKKQGLEGLQFEI